MCEECEEDLTPQQLLEKKACGCATVGELLDQAMDLILVDGMPCPISDVLRHYLAYRIGIDLFVFRLVSEDGMPEPVAQLKGRVHSETLEKVAELVLAKCFDHVKNGVETRLVAKGEFERIQPSTSTVN